MDSTINDRLIFFFDSLGKSYREIERIVGLSNGTIGKLKNGVSLGSDKLEKISSIYDRLNPIWLLKGTGEMLIENEIPDSVGLSVIKGNIALEMIRDLSAENALLKKEIEELKGKKH